MFEEFNINQKDKYFLLSIVILSTILVGYYINFNYNLGIYCSDVYVYLLNSLYYTGKNVFSTGNIFLSPLICFITSIFFRLGLVDKLAIYIVTGAFAIFGNIGFYLLLRRFFDEKLSLTGTVIYSSLTLYLTWLANGTLDVPAVSMIVWIALLEYIAINDNPKFYIPFMIFLILGVFTRYPLLLTFPAFALYYVIEKGIKIEPKDSKYIKKGILIAGAILIITLAIVLIMGNGQFEAGGQISRGIGGTLGSESDPAYNPDFSYYLMNMLNFVSNSHTYFDGNPVLDSSTPLSWGLLIILIAGMGLWLNDHKRKIEKKDILPAIFIILGIISFSRVTSVITIVLVLFGLYLMGRDSEHKIEYFMLGWILSNFIFFSFNPVKVNRYILPVFPAIVYFLLLSIQSIYNHVNINKNILPIILISLFLIQAFAFTFTFEPTNEYKATEDISHYIIDNNPDYEKMKIGVYNIRPFGWWLGENITGIPSSAQSEIDASNVTYYISKNPLNNVTNYTEIKNIDGTYLYEKTNV
ncbi:glycosyltransferase family 39 protein [Methanobrevibacter sp.]|uniref:glycosyltransferase family 39 protein n=1 Tax=Methanobrevibacter sp. TaxID=66852 RepID=UPI0025F3AD62|nr:glycosyltransferase family 39 protein [Methanobrevibacter sp.]